VEEPSGRNGGREREVRTEEPRVVYLITSHRGPGQVVRLVRTLRRGSPRSPIVIHHDQSRSRLEETALEGLDHVYLVPWSITVEWGDFSIVEMNLRAFRWILERMEFDWLVLLSGQDYPIKPLPAIERVLGEASHDGFMETPRLVENRVERPQRGFISYSFVFRYFYRYLKLPRLSASWRFPPRLRAALSRLERILLPRIQAFVFLHPMPPGLPLRLGFRRWRTPFDASFRCYKASPWFTLSRRAVELIVHTCRENPRLVRYYRRTVIPDESLFQTVLFNEPSLTFHDDNMIYFEWSDTSSGSPDILTMDALERILASDKHFARKFDADVDVAVLDALDARLASSPP
jgi:hypothetical protein